MNEALKYIEKVQDLQNETFVHPHQAIIDIIENVREELLDWAGIDAGIDTGTTGEVPLETLLGSLEYKVDCLLEVMNPEFEKDIDALKKLLEILRS